MKFVVERNWIDILGWIWMPNTKGTTTIDLDIDFDKHKIEQIGEPTRENIRNWLDKNAGDFSSIIDFKAVIGEKVIDWSDENNEAEFNQITFPEED